MNTELELKLYFTIFHKKKKCQHPSKWYLVQSWIKIFFIVNQILNKLKVYFYIWRKYLLKVSTEVRIIHQQKPKFGISLNFKKTSIWRKKTVNQWNRSRKSGNHKEYVVPFINIPSLLQFTCHLLLVSYNFDT